MEEDELIHEFQKNVFEKIKIQFSNFVGTETVDIRVYYKVPGTSNEWKPSKKGICMALDHVEELLKGIKMAHDRLRLHKGCKSGKKDK